MSGLTPRPGSSTRSAIWSNTCGGALLTRRPATVQVLVPTDAEALAFRPLELASTAPCTPRRGSQQAPILPGGRFAHQGSSRQGQITEYERTKPAI
jgi:hypothetical protein